MFFRPEKTMINRNCQQYEAMSVSRKQEWFCKDLVLDDTLTDDDYEFLAVGESQNDERDIYKAVTCSIF